MLMVVLEVIYGLIYAMIFAVYNAGRNLFPDKFSKNIEGEIVLITGGGSGIGRLVAQKFAGLGAIIVTIDVNEKGNDETVRMIRQAGHKAHGFVCDLSNKNEIYSVSKTVKSQVGDVSILINNAGIVSGTSLLGTPDDKIVRTFNVNVLAHFWTIKTFLPDMINAKRGHIVTIASLAGYSGTNKLVDYCASKSANIGMDEALKVELMVQGLDSMIKTTVVCPYYISTGMFQGVQSKVSFKLDTY
jgi:all-trans-retinol dehydrogenase (NAD+)